MLRAPTLLHQVLKQVEDAFSRNALLWGLGNNQHQVGLIKTPSGGSQVGQFKEQMDDRVKLTLGR